MKKSIQTFANNLRQAGVPEWVLNQNIGAICYTNVSGAAYSRSKAADLIAEAKEAAEANDEDRLCKLQSLVTRNEEQAKEFDKMVVAAKAVYKNVTGEVWKKPSKTSNSTASVTEAREFFKKRFAS